MLKILLGVFFIVAGINHFRSTGFYLRMMPSYLPLHLQLVNASGGAEIGLGALLLVPVTSAAAAWGLMALLIAVFPANIEMVVHREAFPEFSTAALWLRLPLQFVLIAWAFWYTRGRVARRPQALHR